MKLDFDKTDGVAQACGYAAIGIAILTTILFGIAACKTGVRALNQAAVMAPIKQLLSNFARPPVYEAISIITCAVVVLVRDRACKQAKHF